MHREQLREWEIRGQPNGDLVLWNGALAYGEMIQFAFPRCFRRAFRDRRDGYSFGMFANGRLSCELVDQLQSLLEVFQSSYLLTGIGFECYAADLYMTPTGRTSIGEHIYQAKYHGEIEPEHIDPLVRVLVALIQAHPTLVRSDLVLPMPRAPHSTNRLPEAIAKEIAAKTGIPLCPAVIEKRATPSMKDIESIDDKRVCISGAFTVTRSEQLKDKSILVIDDTIGSGETMRELCDTLMRSGARDAVGLSCAKNLADR